MRGRPRTGSRRVALVVTIVVGVVLLGVSTAAFVACGNGNDKSSPTSFTRPRDTTPVHPTMPPPTAAPVAPSNPRPWRTGMNGELGIDQADFDRDIAGIAATGVRWMRLSFYWAFIQG